MNRGDWVTVDTADAGELNGMLVNVEKEAAEDGSRHSTVVLFDSSAGTVRYWNGPMYDKRSSAAEARDLQGRPDGAWTVDDTVQEPPTPKGAQKRSQTR